MLCINFLLSIHLSVHPPAYKINSEIYTRHVCLSQPSYMNELHKDHLLTCSKSDHHKVTLWRRVFQVLCSGINRLSSRPPPAPSSAPTKGVHRGSLGRHQELISPWKLYYKYSVGKKKQYHVSAWKPKVTFSSTLLLREGDFHGRVISTFENYNVPMASFLCWGCSCFSRELHLPSQHSSPWDRSHIFLLPASFSVSLITCSKGTNQGHSLIRGCLSQCHLLNERKSSKANSTTLNF